MTNTFASKDKNALIFLLQRYARPYSGRIAVLVLLSVLAAFMLPLTALVLAPALHVITLSSVQPAQSITGLSLNNLGPTLLSFLHIDPSNTWYIILAVAVAYVFISLTYSVLNFGSYIMAMRIRTSVGRDVMVDLYTHLLNLPISYFQKRRAGDLISRFTEDGRGTAYALDSVVRGVLQSGIQIVVSVVILLKTEPFLALAAFVLGSGHFAITRLLSGVLKSRMVEQNIALGRLGSVLQEALLTIRVIKSFAAERFEIRRFKGEAENHRSMMMRFVFAKHIEEPTRFFADAVAVSLILILTFQAMQAGRLSLEGFALFIVLARQVIQPISLLSTHLLATSSMLGSARRVMEIFTTVNSMPDGEKEVTSVEKGLVLSNVSFGYDSTRMVLEDIDLTIRTGESLALVGPSGAGKSTLVDLILRFYDPTKGKVTIDGIEIKQLKLKEYRNLFGVVPQECQLFNNTLKENILYGRDYDEKRLKQAIEIANATEFIVNLPKGLDTPVGERGLVLSGGQRQRIAIARAVYGQPSILLLDEATSSLDADSEYAVQKAIDNVVKNISAIIIAHRLSTVRNADRIAVLKDGRLEMVGTHDELLKASKTYSQLYSRQMEQNNDAEK